MFNVIETNDGKFAVKETDAEGNSVRVLENRFVSYAEAQQFIDTMGIKQDDGEDNAEGPKPRRKKKSDGDEE